MIITLLMQQGYLRVPVTECAFHSEQQISHFCRWEECLLPLCSQCLPIHRREHSNKKAPMDIVTIQQETQTVAEKIARQGALLEEVQRQIVAKVNKSNQEHSKLRDKVIENRDQLLRAVSMYYDSLCHELDLNYQRRDAWLRDVMEMYHQVSQELITIEERLQGEKHLRTIIMWDKLKPNRYVDEITKQTMRQLDRPSYKSANVHQIMTVIGQSNKLRVLDLQGDLAFSQLSKVLYTLRFGDEAQVSGLSAVNKTAGLSLTRASRNRKLALSKSTDRF